MKSSKAGLLEQTDNAKLSMIHLSRPKNNPTQCLINLLFHNNAVMTAGSVNVSITVWKRSSSTQSTGLLRHGLEELGETFLQSLKHLTEFWKCSHSLSWTPSHQLSSSCHCWGSLLGDPYPHWTESSAERREGKAEGWGGEVRSGDTKRRRRREEWRSGSDGRGW